MKHEKHIALASALAALMIATPACGAPKGVAAAAQVTHPEEAGWVIQVSPKPDSDFYQPALCNGTIGIKFSSKKDFQLERVLMAPAYLTKKFTLKGYEAITSEAWFHGVHFANLDVVVGDSRLSDGKGVGDWSQVFDLKSACLTTTLTYAGKLRLKHTAYALRHRPYTALLVLELSALEDVDCQVVNQIDLLQHEAVEELQHYLPRHHPSVLNSVVCKVQGGQKGERLAASNTYLLNGRKITLEQCVYDQDRHQIRIPLSLKKGQNIELALIGSICPSTVFDHPLLSAMLMSMAAATDGVERLVSQHRREWDELWKSDIIIEGAPEDQQDVRLALYHLYGSFRSDGRWSTSPTGLSYDGWSGHVFWDVETWMYPPLLIMNPALAKSCLNYRFDRLSAAKANAETWGYHGAAYPWESGLTGSEACIGAYHTLPFQFFSSQCVAIAMWNYFLVTQDKKWLAEEGYPVISAVADFLVSRADRDQQGKYHYRRVIGADETVQMEAGTVDDDAFVNGSAIVALRYAQEAARKLGAKANPMWKVVADNIVLLRFGDGTIQEYDGYKGETIKQVDVDLLTYPLGLIRDRETLEKNLAYYMPRINKRGPAMSHSVLSVIAARFLNNPEEAYRLFKSGYVPNKKPPYGIVAEKPGEAKAYFVTAAGGMLQSVLCGFGGLDITEDGIVQSNPCLPKAWKSLTITGVGPEKRTFQVK